MIQNLRMPKVLSLQGSLPISSDNPGMLRGNMAREDISTRSCALVFLPPSGYTVPSFENALRRVCYYLNQVDCSALTCPALLPNIPLGYITELSTIGLL